MLTNPTYGPFVPGSRDDARIQVPGPGLRLIDRSAHFLAYASLLRPRCAAATAVGSSASLAPAVAGARAGWRWRSPRFVGFLALPDLSELRQLLLAAVGPRAPARPAAELRRATARRPSTRWPSPSARCCRCWAAAATASWSSSPRRRSSCSAPGSTGWRGWPSRRWSASPPPGILCTRFDFPFLAARAYIDIPYLAFVIWAAALRAGAPAPRRDRLGPAGLRRAAAPGGVADHRPVLPVDVRRASSAPAMTRPRALIRWARYAA